MEFFENAWRPRVSKDSRVVVLLLLLSATVTSSTIGFDGSLMSGLNILPQYTEYFEITTAMRGLSSSATYIGGILAGLTYPYVAERLTRRTAMLLAASITIVFVIIQAASVHIGMFTAARIGLGYGKACTVVVAPVYISETLPSQYRGWGLGLVNDCYYIGALIAAGVTYGTANNDGTWSWRLPSLLQAFWSLMCIIILPFLPESPRWLVYNDRNQEALKVLAQIGSNGDESDPLVQAQYQQILETMAFEKMTPGKMTVKEIIHSKSALKRLSLVISCALAIVIVGNQIAAYYFGTMLGQAGITDSTTQLQINIVLNVFCLACAVFGTWLVERVGRRIIALVSTILLTIFLFLIGVFTKLYGNSTNQSAIYGTVATIFLFMGSYSIGWTPLCYIYPPEVLNYRLRSQGMGIYTWVYFAFGLVLVFVLPFMLEDLGWKSYMINGSWNVLLIVFIYFFWVETKGKTLEEIDRFFEPEKEAAIQDITTTAENIMIKNAERTDSP